MAQWCKQLDDVLSKRSGFSWPLGLFLFCFLNLNNFNTDILNINKIILDLF